MLPTKYPSKPVSFDKPTDKASIADLIRDVYQLLGGDEPIGVDISSTGGSVTHALMGYDALIAQEGRIITRNFQALSSSAVLLFCIGARRCALPNATFTVHAIRTRIGSKEFGSLDKLLEFRCSIERGDCKNALKATQQKDMKSALTVIDHAIAQRVLQTDRYIRIVQGRTGLTRKEIHDRFLSDSQQDINLREACDLNLVNAFHI